MRALFNGKSIKVLTVAGMCLGLATACQTTNTWNPTKETVDVSETKFDMELTSFKIKSANKMTEASSYLESVDFQGGYVYRYVYQRGFVINSTEADLRKSVTRTFKKQDVPEPYTVKHATIPLGNIIYAVLDNTKQTCFHFKGYSGHTQMIRGQMASDSTSGGLYCEPGHVSDMEQIGLSEFGKVSIIQ